MFTKGNLAVIALTTAVVASTTLASTGAAQAEVIMRKETINRDVCYQSRRVPATVAYDTRGIPLRAASRSWRGDMQRDGARITDSYNDEVFVQTRRVVENQHVTLVPVPCR